MPVGAIALAVVAGLIPAAAEAGCPSAFEVFLLRFQDDEAFRLEHVRFPVKHAFVDAAAVPEPRQLRRFVARGDRLALSRLSPPTSSSQATRRIERKIVAVSRGGRLVRYRSPDSDSYVVDYRFVRGKSCWELVQVSDDSL